MGNKTIDVFKDPVFRKEVYEYLRGSIIKYMDFLKDSNDGIYSEKYCFPWMCYLIVIGYDLDFVVTGKNKQWFKKDGTEVIPLNVLLPELIRPPISIHENKWFSIDMPGSELKLACINKALNSVERLINEFE